MNMAMNMDIVEVSLGIATLLEKKRPDPAERGFVSRVDDPTPFEICVASLARSLRRQVQNGTLSQSEADKQLAEYRQEQFKLPPNTSVFMMTSTRDEISWLDRRVSMVNDAKDTETSPSVVRNILNGIRGDRWAKPVARVNETYEKALKSAFDEGKPNPVAAAKESVRKLKMKLPGVCCSAACSRSEPSARSSSTQVFSASTAIIAKRQLSCARCSR
jgi:hypothetical protein